MRKLLLFSIFCFALFTKTEATITSARKCITINDDWYIYPASDVRKNALKIPVTLPHAWNASYLDSTLKYSRETMVYLRNIPIDSSLKNKRVFLYFEGVNSVANVIVNGKFVGEHLGGYTAFCFEITDVIKPGNDNKLEVWVSNAYRMDVPPISGDFNIYGGIHRPCHLIITEKNCITPLDYASSGVYIKPVEVTSERAGFIITSKFSIKGSKERLKLLTKIYNEDGKLVASGSNNINSEIIEQTFQIEKPVLWNGKQNPYLYTVIAELLQNDIPIDKVEQKTGFRYFNVDYNKGFFLNGKYLDLYGFCRHEELKGKGSALLNEDIRNDIKIIDESGATSMRLTHYPHSDLTYDLCDENGIVLWTEIPLCGPGGFTGTGYLKNPSLENNIRNSLLELVHQKYNHPSIFFWGLFNEILLNYNSPVPFIKQLDSIAKAMDPSRLTVFATCFDQQSFLGTTNLIAWNKYFGWYQATAIEAGDFFDEMKNSSDGYPVGVSEYGAGASINHHQLPAEKPKPGGEFHPEEWQTLCHEGNWEAFSKRPFIWGKYIWVFADFQSSIRSEGDTPGINDKGLVTHDHTIKKDAFYFYKANWNPEPMIYITSRRFIKRTNKTTDIKAFSNLSEATLYINNKEIGTTIKDQLNRIVWNNVLLEKGINEIKVKGKVNKLIVEDSCTWVLK